MSDTPGWTSPGQRDDEPGPPASPAVPSHSGQPGQPQGQPGQPQGQPGTPPPTEGQVPPGWSQHQPPPTWGAPPPPGPQGWTWANEPEVKPGVVPLRPIGVGEILDGAISTMRAHVRPMLGFSAIVVTVSQLLGFGALALLLRDLDDAAASLDENSSADEIFDAAADTLALTGVSAVIDWVAVLFLTGMLTVVVSKAVLGQPATVSDAWAALRPRLGRLVLVSLVTTLLTGLAGILPVAPGIAAAAAGAPGGLVALLLVPGAIAGFVLMVYVYVSLALATPALVLEKQGVRGAISRSRRLVRGSWWRVLGILLLALLLILVISSIIATPFQIVGGGGREFFTGQGAAGQSTGGLFVATIGQILGATLTYPFSAAVTVLLYVDLRMRREGLDLDLARAAGVRHPREGSGGTGTPGGGPAAGTGASTGWSQPSPAQNPPSPPPPGQPGPGPHRQTPPGPGDPPPHW